jgi:hypothetical protein
MTIPATASKTNTKLVKPAAKDADDAAKQAAKDATKANALELGRIHFALAENTRQFNRSKKLFFSNPVDGPSTLVDAAAKFAATASKLAAEIMAVPAGTTAKGGANRQTVWFEHFAAVNRELKTRMTRAECKAANKNSWHLS